MLPYFRNKDEKLCCGCRACEQICPKQAISMQSNREAFLYPVLKETLCVNCGLCENVCPMINRPRDRLLEEWDQLYPQYGFAKHKGYGTKAHYEAIQAHGILPVHRRSFLKNLEEKS